MGDATTEPGDAVERLRCARHALVTSHASPDGDALGSELALAQLAKALGVDTVIVNRDPSPPSLAELPGIDQVTVSAQLPDGFPAGFDLVVTLECPGLDRPGLEGLNRLPILNIDHHRANERYGEVDYLDEEAPAAGEMVWRMFAAAGVTPDAAAATNAFVALSTDTGDFRYSNATPRAFRAAAEMVVAGARPDQVAEWVHHRRSPASVRLLGEALATLELRCDGRLACLQLTPEAFRRARATPAETEEIVNLPRAIAGVRAVVLFKQWETGIVRVSLRSKGEVDIRTVAASFGGGGHTNAAGCTLHGDLPEAAEPVLEMAAASLGSPR
jgi:bifunctional oligoribonuclease and PAP phosphatase NrnA